MAEELNVDPWTPLDIELLSGAARVCLQKIVEGHRANPNSKRLASRHFLETYLVHLVDPGYTMPIDEDKHFFVYLSKNDPETYDELTEPLVDV